MRVLATLRDVMLTVMAALISAVIIALLVSGAAILRGVTDPGPAPVPSVDVPVGPTDCVGEESC